MRTTPASDSARVGWSKRRETYAEVAGAVDALMLFPPTCGEPASKRTDFVGERVPRSGLEKCTLRMGFFC